MVLFGITLPFDRLSRSRGYVTYPLLTLTPLTSLSITQLADSFDLHVLTTPPAFVLSQDQTLQIVSSNPPWPLGAKLGGIVVEKAQHFSIRTESAEKKYFFKLIVLFVFHTTTALSLLRPFRNFISNRANLA